MIDPIQKKACNDEQRDDSDDDHCRNPATRNLLHLEPQQQLQQNRLLAIRQELFRLQQEHLLVEQEQRKLRNEQQAFHREQQKQIQSFQRQYHYHHQQTTAIAENARIRAYNKGRKTRDDPLKRLYCEAIRASPNDVTFGQVGQLPEYMDNGGIFPRTKSALLKMTRDQITDLANWYGILGHEIDRDNVAHAVRLMQVQDWVLGF